jgi:transposase
LLKKKPLPTLLICDSQAVKNTDSADIETKGFCHYKATNGIKRHLCVDVLGTPFFVTCTPANVTDDDGFVQIVKENINFFVSLPVTSSGSTLTILLDSGYNKSSIEKKIQAIYPDILSKIVIEIAPKISPEEKKARGLSGFIVIYKRWVVERSNSWMEKCRLLWKNCESQLSTSVAEIKLCFIRLILRRLY